MNKYILSIKLILILCLSLQAQTSDIQIKVLTEAENEPLMGATVYFEALEKGAELILMVLQNLQKYQTVSIK